MFTGSNGEMFFELPRKRMFGVSTFPALIIGAQDGQCSGMRRPNAYSSCLPFTVEPGVMNAFRKDFCWHEMPKSVHHCQG